jgi:hypothetical protein
MHDRLPAAAIAADIAGQALLAAAIGLAVSIFLGGIVMLLAT